MNLNGRLNKLKKAMTPEREVYQIRFVGSMDEARQLDVGRQTPLPGEIRYILDESIAVWRAALKANEL